MARNVVFYGALGLFLVFSFAMLGYAYLARTHRSEVAGVVIAREATAPREVPVMYVTSFWRRDSGLSQPMREEPAGYLYTVRLESGKVVEIDADRSADAFRAPTAEVGDDVTAILRWRSLGPWFRSELPAGIRKIADAKDPADLALSLGYAEAAPDAADSGQSWYYKLATDDDGRGTLSVDGFQTMARVAVSAQATAGGIAIVHTSDLDDNLTKQYEPGDLLLVLRPDAGAYVAEWRALQPMLPSSTPARWVAE